MSLTLNRTLKISLEETKTTIIVINNEKEYKVEQILDKRTHYGKIQYLIKWKGYPLSEASWEPEENLNCPKLLKKFNKNN